jgi:hypothetical protein
VIIDIYISSIHDIITFELLWREFRNHGIDASFVAEPPGINSSFLPDSPPVNGSADVTSTCVPLMTREMYRRTVIELEERGIPVRNLGRYDADAVLVDGSISWLQRYEKCLKIKLSGGISPRVDDDPTAEAGFDAVFVHGEFERKRLEDLYGIGNILVTGYPKYASFMRGESKPDAYLAAFGLDAGKKTIAYFPARGTDYAADNFISTLAKLSHSYNVVYKPHTFTALFEAGRIEFVRHQGEIIVDDRPDTVVQLIAAAAIILADVRGEMIIEACLAQKPVIGLSGESNPVNDRLLEIVAAAVPVCRHAPKLETMLEEHLKSDHFFKRRYDLKRHMFTEFYGDDDRITALQIMRIIAERSGVRHSPRVQPAGNEAVEENGKQRVWSLSFPALLKNWRGAEV